MRSRRKVRWASTLPVFLSISVSFGFIVVVVSLAHATWFHLPGAVANHDYVTVHRHTGDGFAGISLADVEQISELIPEIYWFHVQVDRLRIRGPAGEGLTLAARRVPGDFFSILGVQLERGSPTPLADGSSSVILSEPLWRDMYGSDEDIVGRFLEIENGPSLPIAGVAPTDFTGLLGHPADVWLHNAPLDIGFFSLAIGGMPVGEDIVEQWFRKETNVVLFGALLDESMNLENALEGLDATLSDYRFDTQPIVITSPSVPVPQRDGNTGMGPVTNVIGFDVSETDRLAVSAGLEANPAGRQDVVDKTTWLAAIVILLLSISFVSLIDYFSAAQIARRDEHIVRLAIGATPWDLFGRIVGENAAWIVLVAGLGWLFFGYVSELVLRVEPFSAYVGTIPVASQFVGLVVGALVALATFLASVVCVSWLLTRTLRDTDLMRSHRLLRRTTRLALLFVCTASLLIVSSLASRYVGDTRIFLGSGNNDTLMIATSMEIDSPNATTSRPVQPLIDAITAIPGVRSAATTEFFPLADPHIASVARGTVQGESNPNETPFYENRVTPGFFSTLGLDLQGGRVFESMSENQVIL